MCDLTTIDPSPPTCSRCGRRLTLVDKIRDPVANRILRMYECTCGQRTFDERSGTEETDQQSDTDHSSLSSRNRPVLSPRAANPPSFSPSAAACSGPN